MDWLAAPDYWLTRFVFERALGVIYLVAFLVTVNQFRPLLGEHGLLPAPDFIRAVPFRTSPTLFHLFGYSDRKLLVVAWTGVVLSVVAIIGLFDGDDFPIPFASMLIFAMLWVLYLSIVNVGQTFYSFGWESLLVEAGFLAIFLGPARWTPPVLVIWLLRWLVFRLEFGAGLIKLRGDPCWRDLTCLYYHHETQPMPPRSGLPDGPPWHNAIVIGLFVVVVILSWWPVRNLASRRQRMNASFNRLHLVNSYGAFGSITRARHEIVIEGTHEAEVGE